MTFSRSQQLGRAWPWLLGISAALLTVVLLALPVVIERTAEQWVRENSGNDFEIDDVDFNPFTGHIEIKIADASSVVDRSKLLEIRSSNTWVNWLPFLKKRVSLGELALRDARVSIHHDENGQTTIAGFRLPGETETAIQATNGGWQIGFDSLRFENIELDIDSPIAKQSFVVRKLHIGRMASWDPDAGAEIDMQLDGAGGSGRITGEIYPFASPLLINGKIKIDSMQFDKLPETVAVLGIIDATGTVSLDGEINLTRGETADDVTSRISGVGVIENIEFLRPQLRQRFRYGRGVFTGDLLLDYQTGMQAEVDIEGENLGVVDDELGLELIQLKDFNVDDAIYKGINDISAKRLTANDVNLLERESGDPENKNYDLSVARLDVEPIAISLTNFAAGRFELKGMQGFYAVPEKSVTDEAHDQDSDATSQAAENQSDGSFFDTFTIDADQILVHDSSRFTFIDNTIDPTTKIVLDNFELDLQKLDTDNAQEPGDLKIAGTVGKYGSVNITVKSKLGAETTNASFLGELKSLDLSPFSGYVKKYLGYRLVSGSLDADLDGSIDDKTLTAEIDLLANRLRLEELPADEKPENGQSSSVPIGTALSLLRDKDDNIELAIPIQGNLNDLDVGLGDAIGKVLGKATRKSMETTIMVLYAPLGIAKLAGTIAGSAGKLRFQAIEFAPGDATLDQQDTAYLDNVIAMLGKKERIRLSICGFATTADDPALANELATSRGVAVKDYLVQNGGIAQERLFVCSPSVDQAADAQPRTELTI